MRSFFAMVFLLMLATSTRVAFAGPTQPNSSSFCKPIGGDSGVIGRASFGTDAIVPTYLLVFPQGPAFDAYAKSLASPTFDFSKPAPSFDEQRSMLATQGEQTRLVSAALESSKVAMLDKKGNFECGGLPTGAYVVVIPVMKREYDRALGGNVSKSTYYIAVANLPKRSKKDRRAGRLLAPMSNFAPMNMGR